MEPVNNSSLEINEVLLRLNEEYKQLEESKEYNIGRRLLKYKAVIKRFDFKYLIDRLIFEKQVRELMKYGYVHKDTAFYNKGKPSIGFRGVVYTCITGTYDKIHSPYYRSNNCDYYLLSDNNVQYDSSWEIRRLDEFIDKNDLGDVLKNRYVKMNPFEVFPDYDFSIYVDGNVTLVGDVSYLYDIARNSSTGIAMHEHPTRNCIYSEGKACEALKRGNVNKIKDQLSRYEAEGFPHEFGMCEATIIVVDLRNIEARKIMQEWWEEFYHSGSLRDQLAFPYVLWKRGYHISDVGILGSNKKYNPYFRVDEHL